MALIEVTYEDNGAEKVISNVNQVTSSVAKLKKQLQTPLGGGMGAPAINAFTVNAKNAANAFTHMGITYQKMAAKMKSPLGGNQFLTPQNFTAAAKGITATGQAYQKAGEQAKQAGQHMGFVTRLLAAMAIRKIATDIAKLTDAWTTFENKIKTVVQGQAALNVATSDLVRIAIDTRMPVEAVGQAFSRTMRAVQALGKGQFETTKFTEALSKAIQVGGSTTAESTNAMIQLSQGMASGALRGDELRSVLEQLPVVAQLIADKMGVTVGELRKLGAAGKLTTDVVFSAITEGGTRMDALFKKMQPTIEQAFTVLKNKFLVAVGEASKLTRVMADGLMYLAENFDRTLKVATAFLGSISAMIGLKTGWQMVMAAWTNPWVALATAIVAATTALAAFSDKMKDVGSAVDANVFGNALFDTWKQDLTDLVSMAEKFIGVFTEAPIKLSHSWDTMYRRLAVVGDFLRTALNPEMMVGAHLGDKDALEYVHRLENNLKRAEQEAIGNKKTEDMKKFADTNARFNLMLKEMGAIPAGPGEANVVQKKGGTASAGKDTKEKGKTFSELLEDAELDALRASVNDLDAIVFERLEKALDKLKPSIVATLKDADKQISAIQKQFAMEESKHVEEWMANPALEKKARDLMNSRIAGIKEQSAEYAKQYELLEEQYRIEVTRDFYAKERLEKEKESLQRMEEMVQKENERTKAIEARRRGRPGEEEDFMNRVAGELDPTQSVREKIEELNHFKELVRDQPEFVTAADKKIRELRDSMTAVGQAGKILGDDMNSIFGPGGSLSRGFADAIVNAKNLNQALRELLDSLGKQALSSLIQLPINAALGSIFGQSPLGAVSSSAGLGGTGGSYGIPDANFVDDTPGISSSQAAGRLGFASGGYTGDYARNQVAGVVHGQEYVMNADATRANRPLLEAMNSGTAMPGGRIIINNNAPGVEIQARENGPDVEMVVAKKLQEQIGPAVAAILNNPNSQASKAVGRNWGLNRSRK